jgi:ribosome biogenesis GTPase A
MRKYDSLVDTVVRASDVVLVVIDARRIEQSINKELEQKILSHKKKFLYVINKCDLVSKEDYDNISLFPSVKFSATEHQGSVKLLQKIMRLASKDEVVVGVVGYPNTGKSSVINALKGSHAAPTSPVSGFTKSLRKVRITQRLMMIDTPGVIPYPERSKKDNADMIIIGAIDYDKIKDPETAAMEMIAALKGKIEKFYDVKINEDPEDTLKEIALKKGMLKKRGIPDLYRAAKDILMCWQKGKIR